MTEEDVETLLAGHEDANGCINYEGKLAHFNCYEEWQPNWLGTGLQTLLLHRGLIHYLSDLHTRQILMG